MVQGREEESQAREYQLGVSPEGRGREGLEVGGG